MGFLKRKKKELLEEPEQVKSSVQKRTRKTDKNEIIEDDKVFIQLSSSEMYLADLFHNLELQVQELTKKTDSLCELINSNIE